jgi:hypothetical protein
MALFDDQEKLMSANDGQNAGGQAPEDKEDGKYLGLIIGACTLPVVFLVGAFGTINMGLTAGFCLGMNIFAAGACWDLRRRWWFWCVMIFMLALHVPLVAMFPWPHRRIPGIELLPIGLADMAITIGVVRFVQKFIVRRTPPSDEDA